MRNLGKKIICFSGVFGMFAFLFILLGMEFSHSEGGKIFISLLRGVSILVFPSAFLVGISLYFFGKNK